MIKIEIQIEQMPSGRISISHTSDAKSPLVDDHESYFAARMLTEITNAFAKIAQETVRPGKPITLIQCQDNELIEKRRDAFRRGE